MLTGAAAILVSQVAMFGLAWSLGFRAGTGATAERRRQMRDVVERDERLNEPDDDMESIDIGRLALLMGGPHDGALYPDVPENTHAIHLPGQADTLAAYEYDPGQSAQLNGPVYRYVSQSSPLFPTPPQPPTDMAKTEEKPHDPHGEVIALLRRLGNGELLDVMAENLQEMERAISLTGKAASLTIKIKVRPNGHAKRVISFEDKVTLPKVAASDTWMFATPLGQYVENDPDQRQLPLENVERLGDAARKLEAVPERKRSLTDAGE